jgi:hypothetical protein
MSYILKNNQLEVEIAEPMERYRASRFDHSGNILQVTFEGKHTFCSSEKVMISSNHGFGLMNEFDIDEPFSFNGAKAGDYFHKIGVGALLKEEDQSYNFFTQYANQPLDYLVSMKGADQLIFHAESATIRGMAYQFTKKITIAGNQLVVEYQLLNSGSVSFDTSEYGHNFMAVNHRKVDASYVLKLNQTILPENFTAAVNLDVLDIQANELSWKSVPASDFFISGLSNNQLCKCWSIEHLLEKVGVSEEVDFECRHMNLWGNAHVVSPELFHKIKLEPNQQHIWHRSYTFYNL